MAKIFAVLQKKQGIGLIKGLPEFSFTYHNPETDQLANWMYIGVSFGNYQDDPLSDPSVDGITVQLEASESPSFNNSVVTGIGGLTNGKTSYIRFPYEWGTGQKYIRAKFTNNQGQVGYKHLTTRTTAVTASWSGNWVYIPGYDGNYAGSPFKYWGIDDFRLDYDEYIYISPETHAKTQPRIEWAGYNEGTGRGVDMENLGLKQWLNLYDDQGSFVHQGPQWGTRDGPYGDVIHSTRIKSARVQIQQSYGMAFRWPDGWGHPNNFSPTYNDPAYWYNKGMLRPVAGRF